MIDFFHVKYYYEIWLYFTLVIVLFTYFHTILLKLDDSKNTKYLNTIGIFVLFFTIIYMGWRPISGYFTDMITYAGHFKRYALGYSIYVTHDVFFHEFMKLCSQIMSANNFFLFCAFLYIYPMYVISKKFFKNYWFYCFAMYLVSFSFWSYGVNGIRNGIATSFFLMAFAYHDKKKLMIFFMILACLFHKTLLLPTIAFIATLFYNNPRTYIKVWLIAIPLSLLLGSVWTTLFSNLGFADERMAYLTGPIDAKIKNTGFRWDFLFYSTFAIFSGWYFIFKRGFKDIYYHRLYNIFLTANAFWILVIKANFSERIAYISWFMMPIIIIYPLLKQSFFKNQNLIIGKILLMYFLFTFLMYFIYYQYIR